MQAALTDAGGATDEALLELIRLRDLAALRALWDRHGGALLASAGVMARYRSDFDAEQAVVDAFTAFWRAPPPTIATDTVRRHLIRLLGACARTGPRLGR